MGELSDSVKKAIKPLDRLTVSEWADRHRFLSKESSAEHGKWRTDRAPYQRELMDVVANKTVKKVVVMSSAQIGKSEILLNCLGYFLDYAPAPTLLIQPTLEMAQAFSKDRIAPMLRDSPCFEGKLRASRSENSGNTLLHKQLKGGGQVTLTGSNSPASLASRPVQNVFGDEIDRWTDSAGTEGDPIRLAEKRTATFWNSLVMLVSTPTVKGASRIEKAWELSDQRHYLVPCPKCKHEQAFVWEGILYDGKGQINLSQNVGELKNLRYQCASCGTAIAESQKPEMLRKGHWQPTKESAGVAGFHINELYSPWKSWQDVALDYESAKDDSLQLQVWWNTSLGLPFEPDTRQRFDWENLLYRAESSDYSQGQVPEAALFLTAGVDVQGDRLECSVFGWGEGEQSFLIGHYQLFGDPLEDEIWADLDDLLNLKYPHPLGGTLSIRKAAIDTGYQTHDVYGQVRQRRNWLAIKGVAGDRQAISTPSQVEVNWRGKKIKRGIKLHILGVDTIKTTLLSRCRIDKPGDKYLNIPQDAGEHWCRGFAGSEIQVKKHRNGQPYFVWEKLDGVRNEPLDCAVYAFAAALQLGLTRTNWDKLRRSLTVSDTIKPEPTPEPQPELPEESPKPKLQRRQRQPRRNSFINRY